MKLVKRPWTTSSGTDFVEYTVSFGGAAGAKGVPYVQWSWSVADSKINFQRKYMARRLWQVRRTLRERQEDMQHQAHVAELNKRKRPE